MSRYPFDETSLAKMREVMNSHQRAIRDVATKIAPITAMAETIYPNLEKIYASAQIPDISKLFATASVYQAFDLKIASFTSNLAATLAPTMETMRTFSASFANQQAQIATYFAQFAEKFVADLHRTLSDSFEPLRRLARSIGESQEVADAFQAYGLWLAPSMPKDLVEAVVRMYQAEIQSRTVHSVVSRRYSANGNELIKQALASWEDRPATAPRIRALRQAVDAHERGHYAVSVPALLTHVEGIAADYVRENNLSANIGSKTREIVATALEEAPCSLFDVQEYAAITCLHFYVENHLYRWTNFQKRYVGLRSARQMNGHAVRHGRQINYDTRMNSLKLILMVDALSLLK